MTFKSPHIFFNLHRIRNIILQSVYIMSVMKHKQTPVEELLIVSRWQF